MTPFFVVVGVALRLGIPVVLTIAVTWWLRRLDAQWQREARRPPEPSAPPVALGGDLDSCPFASRAPRAAADQPDTPCWEAIRSETGDLQPACLNCPVFRNALAETASGKEGSHV